MPASGCSWSRCFGAVPQEARSVRCWTGSHIPQGDAPLVAHELFVACLGTRPAFVEMTLSTADHRIRITARGPVKLPVRCSHGPGLAIIRAFSITNGTTSDGCAVWAELVIGNSALEEAR